MSIASGSRTRRVVSLEAFIIDTVIHEGYTNKQDDQIGGSGTYAMVGARMFLPPTRLGMVINYSPETFPGWMRDHLESFGEGMWYFKNRKDGRGTTRSIQLYKDGIRTETLVDPLLCDPIDLYDTPFANPLPTTIHMTSLLDRTKVILGQVDEIGRTAEKGWRPTIVWEPYYADSIPSNLETMVSLIPQVDIFSPNHLEALTLCSMSTCSPTKDDIEAACIALAAMRPKQAVVIRAGALGACYTLTSTPGEVSWVPAFWGPSDGGKVVDVTGAGNSFLGGLCAGLDEGLDVRQSVIWGSVAASFVVQQVGLPILSLDRDGSEIWNGASVRDRVTHLDRLLPGLSL